MSIGDSMENMHIIDYVINTTRSKGGNFNSYEYIKTALSQFCKYNYSKGFTSTGEARNYIEGLSMDDIDRELLKNLVKKKNYASKNSYNLVLGSNKQMSTDLEQSELEYLFIENMKKSPIDVEDYLLNKKEEPSFRDRLIESFVDSRYFNPSYGAHELDECSVFPEYKYLLDKIDQYYDVLKIEKKKEV
jgi:hypothetical protein